MEIKDQVQIKEEKKLRKCEHPSGTWVYLGDGEKWCISALPLGKSGDEILDKIEKVFALQETETNLGVTEIDEIRTLRKYIKAGGDFAFSLLKLNYPGLTKEYFEAESLVTTQQVNFFVLICQGGTGLGDIIGAPKDVDNEAKKKE